MLSMVSDRERNQGSRAEEVAFQDEGHGAGRMRIRARSIAGKLSIPKMTQDQLSNNPAKPCEMPRTRSLNYTISHQKTSN